MVAVDGGSMARGASWCPWLSLPTDLGLYYILPCSTPILIDNIQTVSLSLGNAKEKNENIIAEATDPLIINNNPLTG